MKIGIDISQIAYEHSGVAQFTKELIRNLLNKDTKNSYILFGSSLRNKKTLREICQRLDDSNHRSIIKLFSFPQTLLDLLWNRLHIFPIEWLIGDVDVFITSDWTEPPTTKAKKATILYDLIVYKTPQETDKKIVDVQKRKLNWVKKESSVILCISEATKKDAMEILGIEERRLRVIYPGVSS